MRRTLLLGFGVLFLSAFGAPAAPLPPIELAPGASFQTLGQVYLPCEITILGENQSAKTIEVDLNASRVKTKSGLWETLEVAGGTGVCSNSTIGFEARAEATQVACTLEQACSQERRYKFRLTYDGNIVWAYYPSADGWTTDRVLDLGDVGRYFRGY